MNIEMDLCTMCDLITEYLSLLRLITSTVASSSSEVEKAEELEIVCEADSATGKVSAGASNDANDNFVILIQL